MAAVSINGLSIRKKMLPHCQIHFLYVSLLVSQNKHLKITQSQRVIVLEIKDLKEDGDKILLSYPFKHAVFTIKKTSTQSM